MNWYEFDCFQFEAETKILRKEGQRVALPLKAAELLLFFLKLPGKLFTNQELLKENWTGTSVEESNLTYQVFVIRKALGKRPSGEEYIENLPKLGYRFIAPVSVHSLDHVEAQAPSAPPEHFSISEVPLHEPDAVEALRSRAVRSSVRHRAIYAISTVAILLAIALITTLTLRLARSPRISVAQYVRLTNDEQEKGDFFLATDGARVYFTEKQPSGEELTTVAVGGRDTGSIHLSQSYEAFYGLYPPTAELLAGRSTSDPLGPELWSVPLLGPPARRIGDLRADSAGWSPDGHMIAFTLGNDLYVANADGSGSRKIAKLSGHPSLPRWSGDGKLLRFSEVLPQDGETLEAIWEVGADGSNLHRILSGWNHHPIECCGVWTPDAKFFVFQSKQNGRNDLWAIPEQRGLFGTESGSPVRLSSGAQELFSPAISADGKQVFAIGTIKRGELVRYDSRLGQFVRFLGGIPATSVCFSKSGRWVAYVDYRDNTVWRVNADGSQKTQITFPPLVADSLAWSPDETTIAFRGQASGKRPMIYSVPSSGGDARAVVPGEKEQGMPTWSADGRRIAFGDVPPIFGKASGGEAIHILELSSHVITELPGSQGLWTSRWSPDGRYLSALTIVGQKLRLYDFKTKRWRSTEAEAVGNPTWSSDSQYIYFHSESDDRALLRLRVADGHLETIVNLRAYPDLDHTWSGVAPDNSPLILENFGGTEIYSLALEYR